MPTTSDNYRCIDEDECLSEVAKCPPNSQCDNTDGGYTCTCSPGYEDTSGTGDADTDGQVKCTGTIQLIVARIKITITINRQFYSNDEVLMYQSITPIRVTDINECERQLSDCDDEQRAFCINFKGGYKCECKPGYEGDDGTICTGERQIPHSSIHVNYNKSHTIGKPHECVEQLLVAD